MKPSSPTRLSLIRSKNERLLTRRSAIALALCAALGSPAWAHEGEVHASDLTGPEASGFEAGALRLGVAAAVGGVSAAAALPSQNLPGFVGRGDAGIDRRPLQLEHGVVSATWQATPRVSAQAAIGWHGSDPAHVEAAWVQWQPSDAWRIGAGRRAPSWGAVMAGAGHLDRFGLMPLVKQQVLQGDMGVDNGVEVGWRGRAGDWPLRADLGLWQGKAWPGTPPSPLAVTAHVGTTVGTSLGEWSLDGFAGLWQPRGRGTRTLTAAGLPVHSHTAPLCDATLTQVVCFDGRVLRAGVTARWSPDRWPVQVSGALIAQRESGSMTSKNGQGAYQQTLWGGWIEGVWSFHPQWDAGVRLERLVANTGLIGTGATLVGGELGLTGYAPAQRATLMLGWQPTAPLTLRLEAGRESAGGKSTHFAALRAVLQFDDVGRWWRQARAVDASPVSTQP